MSDLQAQDLRKSKTLNLLTTRETSLIVGGSTVTIDNSFNDLVHGGPDDDLILTGPGNDTLDGGLGNDTLAGGSGKNRINGGPGDDDIYLV